MDSKYYSITPLLAVLALILFGAACSNSASSNEEEHGEAEGFRLKMNGQTIVEQLPGQDIVGHFDMSAGQETDLISIYFIESNGDEFQPDEAAFELGYEFTETGVAAFEQHQEDGKWSFHFLAESEGLTSLRLKLLHSGHSDFTTQDISIEVQATQ